MKRPGFILAGCALVLGGVSAVQAAVSYAVDGSTYSQNFDSLPNTPTNTNLQPALMWQDDTTPTSSIISIPGWYLYHPTVQSSEGGTNTHQRFRNSSGNSNTGSFYSFGTNSTTDRALGDIGSNTLTPTPPTPPLDIYIALRLTNNTGHTLNTFTLNYTGEQWRDGGATTPNAQTMTFGWSTTATLVNDPNTSFTDVPLLAFTSPTFANTGSGGALDGNAVANRTALSATVSGLNWANGADLWLRWDDINHDGNDHGLSIDDLSFSATVEVPEPGSLVLLGASTALLVTPRRRK